MDLPNVLPWPKAQSVPIENVPLHCTQDSVKNPLISQESTYCVRELFGH